MVNFANLFILPRREPPVINSVVPATKRATGLAFPPCNKLAIASQDSYGDVPSLLLSSSPSSSYSLLSLPSCLLPRLPRLGATLPRLPLTIRGPSLARLRRSRASLSSLLASAFVPASGNPWLTCGGLPGMEVPLLVPALSLSHLAEMVTPFHLVPLRFLIARAASFGSLNLTSAVPCIWLGEVRSRGTSQCSIVPNSSRRCLTTWPAAVYGSLLRNTVRLGVPVGANGALFA